MDGAAVSKAQGGVITQRHCTDMMGLLMTMTQDRLAIERCDAHYTADSLVAVVGFGGKKYQIEVKEDR